MFDILPIISPIAPPIAPPKLPPPDADVMYQNVPQTMIAGQSYPIKITMQNIVPFSILWNETNKVRLGADPAAPDTAKFGKTRFYIPAGKTVKGGEQHTFEFQMTAPSVPGTYKLSYRMVWESHIWFGEPVNTIIQVAPKAPPQPECVPIAGKVWECGGMLAEDQYDRYDCIDGEITFIEHNSLRCGYQAPQPEPQTIAPPKTLIIPDENMELVVETPSEGIGMGTIAIVGAAALALVGGFILLKNKDKVEK